MAFLTSISVGFAARVMHGQSYASRVCFSTSLPLPGTAVCKRSRFLVRTNQKHVDHLHSRVTANASIVILGGSSGVGKEAAQYLESSGAPVKAISRSTGYDFRNQEDSLRALTHASRAAISVGAGRRETSSQDELDLYKNIARAVSLVSDLELAVVILRSLILPEVRSLFQQSVTVPWVLLRPGPLVDKRQTDETTSPIRERVLVTPDIRCNGLVGRAAVGRVLGDLLLGKVPTRKIEGQVFGVYDLDRMINHPPGIEVIGKDLWQ